MLMRKSRKDSKKEGQFIESKNTFHLYKNKLKNDGTQKDYIYWKKNNLTSQDLSQKLISKFKQ